MKKILIFWLFIFSINSNAQSPWTQKKGEFYTQLSFSTIPSYNTIYGNPDYTISGKITDNSVQFYGEYGFSDKTTFILTVPYKIISREGFQNPDIICITTPCGFPIDKKISDFGNIEIGIKHIFSSKKWLISGQLSVEANTNSFDAHSGIRTGYDAWSFTPIFIMGKSTEKKYIQLFTGTTFRTNNYSSNFKIGGEYGFKVSKKLWLATFIDVVKSLKNGSRAPSYITTATYVNDQEYGGFGFKGIYEFSNNFGINAGLGGAFFANNVAKQAALNIGVYSKF